MASKSDGKRSGIGFFSLLGLLFIGLKLAGFIDWAWWVVLAPIWGQLVFFFACVFIYAFIEVMKDN